MAFLLSDDIAGECTPTVKNTFIDYQFLPVSIQPRRNSVPPSSRLCRESLKGFSDGKALAINATSFHSDMSTDATTDGSTCSESGIKTPTSLDDCCASEAQSAQGWPQDACSRSSWLVPPAPKPHVARKPAPSSQSQRLNSKAMVFQPKNVSKDEATKHYKHHFEGTIKRAKKALESSGNVAGVEFSHDGKGYYIMIQPHEDACATFANTELLTERLLTLAKEALLEAASKSKCIYLMGYCSAKPFIMHPQGFEARLGAMENATTACWHVFKKGFCRHSAECVKQHAPAEVPVHVLVEAVQCTSCTQFASSFKQEVADLTMAVIATLGESAFVSQVEAFKDKDCQGWTIEVIMSGAQKDHKEYLLTVAQSALFSATNSSKTVYIMGYAVKPFIAKSHGFVTLLGDMQDESRACWDLYTHGVCNRDRECRLQHPECFTPLNIVVKEGPLRIL